MVNMFTKESDHKKMSQLPHYNLSHISYFLFAIFWFSFFLFFKKRFHLFIFRERGRERGRERNIKLWLSPAHPLLGTWPTTQACALTGNSTCDPVVHRLALNPLSHTSQEYFIFSIGIFLQCNSCYGSL